MLVNVLQMGKAQLEYKWNYKKPRLLHIDYNSNLNIFK